jgi:CRP-like cAMP-binding protein
MLTEFIGALETILPVKPEVEDYLREITSVQKLHKGSILLSEGQISDRIFYIQEGLVRCFYFEKNEEITSWIVAEGNFICSTYSFIQQKPSFETIQLLEDSVVFSLSHAQLEECYQKFPEMAYVSLKISENYLLLHDERVRSLRLSAAERYDRFQKQFPGIVSRTKTQHLASYLGLSRSCLNLIRAKKKS